MKKLKITPTVRRNKLFQFRMSEREHQQLDELCKKHQVSKADLIRQALRKFDLDFL